MWLESHYTKALHRSVSRGQSLHFFLEGGGRGGDTSLPVSHITSCFAADAPSGRVYFINASMTYIDFRQILIIYIAVV